MALPRGGIMTLPTSPSLDPAGYSHAAPTGQASTGISYTATVAGDIIIMVAGLEPDVTVESVTGGGLTWHQRSQGHDPSGIQDIEVWWAYCLGIFSDAVTINLAGSVDDAAYLVFGVQDADPDNPWDMNASLPALATIGPVAVSTTTADDFILAVQGYCNGSTPTGVLTSPLVLFANVGTGGGARYESVAAASYVASGTLSSVDLGWVSVAGGAGMVIDALVPVSSGPPPATGSGFFAIL